MTDLDANTASTLMGDSPAIGNPTKSASKVGVNLQRFTQSRSFRMTLAKLAFITTILVIIMTSQMVTDVKGFKEQYVGFIYKSLSVFLITKGVLGIFDLLFNVDYGLLEFVVDPD